MFSSIVFLPLLVAALYSLDADPFNLRSVELARYDATGGLPLTDHANVCYTIYYWAYRYFRRSGSAS